MDNSIESDPKKVKWEPDKKKFTERMVATGLIVSPEYTEKILPLLKNSDFDTKWGRAVHKAVLASFKATGQFPRDIETAMTLYGLSPDPSDNVLEGKFIASIEADYLEEYAKGEREYDVANMIPATHEWIKIQRGANSARAALDYFEAGNLEAGQNEFVKALKPSVFDNLELAPADPIPAWPHEAMAGAAGRFAEAYSQVLECPVSFLFMNYLTLLGHILSDRISLLTELDTQPRLYTVCLGESADTRKSTSVSKTADFFHETAPDTHLCFGTGSAEGLALTLESYPKTTLVLDELAAMVQKCKIDGSVLLPCVTTLFESGRFHNATKRGKIQVDGASLCLLGASTLDTYKSMFSSRFLDIGLINRLFIVIGDSKRKFSVPMPLAPGQYEALQTDLREILLFVEELGTRESITRRVYRYPMTPEAQECFDRWYFGQEKSVFTKRLDTYGHRLMPLLAVNEKLDIITPEIAEKTVALLDYQLEARQFGDPVDADSKIAALEQTIRKLLDKGAMWRSDLEKWGHKQRVGSWLWRTALNNVGVETIRRGKGIVYRLKDE
jgi:hypothetical protein